MQTENLKCLSKRNAVFESLACLKNDKNDISIKVYSINLDINVVNISKSLWRAQTSQGE